MKTENDKKLTFTVCIPTCYGGESILETVKSIRTSKEVGDFRFIITADSKPISEDIRKELKNYGVELYWNDVPGSQVKKLKPVYKMCTSDIIINTQDDIIFDPTTISKIVRAFQVDESVTLAGVRVRPLPPINFFESVMGVMLKLVDKIGIRWRNGDNRLMASGRCMIYRTAFLQKFNIPEDVVNSDIFMYLENKRLGGKFISINNASIYIRCPQSLRDQIGPSSRYQYGKSEMLKLFGDKVKSEFPIPFKPLALGIFEQFIESPIKLIAYTMVFAYTRIFRQRRKEVITPLWNVDVSTKSTVQ